MSNTKLKDTKFHKLYYQKPILFVVGLILVVGLIFALDFLVLKRFDISGFMILTGVAGGLGSIEIYTRGKSNKILVFLSVLFCMSLALMLMYGHTTIDDMAILRYHLENIGISLVAGGVGIMWGLLWANYRRKL